MITLIGTDTSDTPEAIIRTVLRNKGEEKVRERERERERERVCRYRTNVDYMIVLYD